MDRIDSFANFVIVRENDNMEERNDIVIYKSEDGLVMMEAMIDPANETIWANQKAIAALFGVTVPNISYHLGRIFKSSELEADTVVKEILITAQSGARGTSDEKIRYYNTWEGRDLYPSIEEKAAMLLYLVVKNHSFVDGNKRIAATLFLWFMQNNGILYRPDGSKRISDASLVALTLMIAESHTDEMDTMVKVVVSLINRKN